MTASRSLIPENWAARLPCPVCNSSRMYLFQPLEGSDQMVCPNCGLGFELEDHGDHLKLIHIPKGLPPGIVGSWFTMTELIETGKELAAWNAQKQQTPQPFMAENPSILTTGTASVLPDEENSSNLETNPAEKAEKQATDLYKLGNSIIQIRKILENKNKFTSGEINQTVNQLILLEENKHTKQKRNLVIIGGLLIFLVICVIASFILIQSNSSESGPLTTNPQSTVAGFVNPKSLPSVLQTAIPAGVKVINPPTPSVRLIISTSNPNQKCPQTKLEAGQVFGGSAQTWQFNTQSQGWMYISSSPVTIHVPAKMSAGYLVFDPPHLEMRSAIGPATIYNIYMITISCE